jgi:histidine triad (HIT) family protein
MSSPDCVFCRIVRGELPSDVVKRTESFIAIQDINPRADVHLLVIPELHFESFREIGVLDEAASKRMLEFVAETARGAGLDEYRLIISVGAGAGQTVFHLHWHILGGQLRGLPL